MLVFCVSPQYRIQIGLCLKLIIKNRVQSEIVFVVIFLSIIFFFTLPIMDYNYFVIPKQPVEVSHQFLAWLLTYLRISLKLILINKIFCFNCFEKKNSGGDVN